MKKRLAVLCAGLTCAGFAATTGLDNHASGNEAFVSFSTTHDTHTDGTTVADGEWYALC